MTTTWATLEMPLVIELTSSCVCEEGDCWGYDCYTVVKEDLEENIFPEFMERIGNPDYLKIVGRNMGWQRVTGYRVVEAEFNKFFDSFLINGEWTLKFTLSENILTVQRYSHDEPTGCSFTIETSTEEEYNQ